MQVQIDPLILVLDFEQLRLRSKEELLVLLRDHILLIIMGQLRDIKERERLSRGLCREYNLFFEAHDIQVFPHPLSTKQTDARLIAPRKLAHLIGITTNDMLSRRAIETRVAPVTPEAPGASETGESSEQAAAPRALTRLARWLRFALLLFAALLPLVGVSQIQPRSKVAFGLRDESLLDFGQSTKRPRSQPTAEFAGLPMAIETDRRVVWLRAAESKEAVGRPASSRARSLAEDRLSVFVERLRPGERRALALAQASRSRTFERRPRSDQLRAMPGSRRRDESSPGLLRRRSAIRLGPA